jgi:hypothetical protein
MATNSAYSGDDPRRMLSNTRGLTRTVRMTQRATWFPLLVFAAATFAAIPVYRLTGSHIGSCATVAPGGRICAVAYTAAFVYWPIVFVLAYVAIAAFYIRRSRARGVETRVRRYVIAGIILAVAVTGFGWVVSFPAWLFLPRLVIDGSVLLLGGIGFLLAQRPWQRAP